MKKILVLIVMLGLNVDSEQAAAVADERSKKFGAGHEYLKQQKYQEARAAFEADLQQHPENALAHFYLGDACRGLKAWACAEEHYEISLGLNAKSTVAGLAKQRARKAKVWRLLDEGKQVVNEPDVPPQQLTQAEHTLDMANKLGLDDEQRAIYQQLHVKIQQQHKVNFKTPSLPQHLERSMVLVPAGEFLMGSWTGDADERPVRRVYLDAYFFDKDQLTVGEYAKFLDATSHSVPADWNIMSRAMHKNRPVVNVDWADAAAYCKWAGKRQPTEAEWEKAARGTDGRTYPWGDEPPTKFHGNMNKELWNSHMGLTPVGMFEDGKSPYGINDMAGNVWEWVSDWYDDDYYHTAPSRNPTGPAMGISKVVRGGSWGSGPEGLRSAERETHVPSFQGYGTGFRCAMTP
jgi:formylglycine-generating enzyme required for sulfatase activity